MITIRYSRNQKSGLHRLRMEGHAGYAAAGEDIVCAACSALGYAYSETLRVLEGAKYCRIKRLCAGDGQLDIIADTGGRPEGEMAVCVAMLTVEQGFRALQEQYPKNVKFDVIYL